MRYEELSLQMQKARKMIFNSKLLFSTFSVSLLLGGISQASAQRDGAQEKRSQQQEVFVNLADEPPSMDPTKYVDTVSSFWLYHIYEGLMTHDKAGKVVLGTAESYDVSKDKKKYTFKIRKNAKWHDGKPVTAHHFEYAFKRLVDPGYASEYSFIAETAQIENAADIVAKKKKVSELGVKATDEHTLVVSLSNPVPYFLSIMAFQTFVPVRADLVEKFKEKFSIEPESIVGNGPFKLVSWKKENSMRLEKSPNFWNASNIKINAIETPSIIKDANSSYNVFTTGGLDFQLLDSTLLKLAQRDKLRVASYPDNAVSFITNNRREGRLFSNVKLRQALRFGLNRSEYVNKIVALPGTKPAFGFVPDTIPGSDPGTPYRKSAPMKWKDADVAKAKALIKDYLKETKQTQVPSFSILANDTTLAKQESEYLQAYLSKLFETEVKIDNVPFKTRLQKSRDGQFDVALSGWSPDYPDAMTFLSVFSAPSENNRSGWEFSKYNQLLEKAQATADASQRNKLMYDAEKLLIEQGVAIPYLQSARPYVIAEGLQDVKRRTFGPDPDFRYAHWRTSSSQAK